MSVTERILNNNQALHGIWRVMPSIAISEIIAQSGFDYQILDCEHGAYDYATLYQDIIACELYGCAPFVRVSGLNAVEVQRTLDIGAHGIVFPQLKTPEDFKVATAMMQYPPNGTRGFNPFVRTASYGVRDGRKPIAPLCITIIETLTAVDALDEILALPGIDMIYIGSYDLSAQLGCMGQMDAPELVAVVDKIISKCTINKKHVALMVNRKDQYEVAAAKGVKGFVHSVDSFRIKNMFSEYLKSF